MNLLSAEHWKDYHLIDSGGGEKLERFGAVVLRRPEPRAMWPKWMKEEDWRKKTDARFFQAGKNSGKWEHYKKLQDTWQLQYAHNGLKLKFQLEFSKFKHVGIFPEQAANWDYIYQSCKAIPNAKVLNLFAYTGGASLAARAGGADVIHCDSIRSSVNWAKTNMQNSGLSDIRWLLEDAFKFVKREAKRGHRYNGIILDPPAWGNGPKGEKWKLEEMINELVFELAHILSPQKYFFVLNSYALGMSSLTLYNLVHTYFGPKALKNSEYGELFMPERSGRKLPMGVFMRFRAGS